MRGLKVKKTILQCNTANSSLTPRVANLAGIQHVSPPHGKKQEKNNEELNNNKKKQMSMKMRSSDYVIHSKHVASKFHDGVSIRRL